MKFEIQRKYLKESVSSFEVLSGLVKQQLTLKLSLFNEEGYLCVVTDVCELSAQLNGKIEEEGVAYVSLEKLSEFLKKCKKNLLLSIRTVGQQVVIVDEDLNQYDVTADSKLVADGIKEDVAEIGVIETLPLEKGAVEVSRSISKSNDLYPLLNYAKWSFDANELKMVSFDEEVLTLKRINLSNHGASLFFYLTKEKNDLVGKMLSTTTDTHATIMYGKETGRMILKTESLELRVPVEYFPNIELEKISNLDGRFFPTTLDAVMNDLKFSVPRRPLTEEEVKKYTDTINKSKQGTVRWNEAAFILKLGAPVFSMSDIMLKPYYCTQSQRLRFVVSGSKQELTEQSLVASTLIQTLKDCESNTAQIKIPLKLTDPLAIVYQDDVSTFERYFMLTLETN